MRDNIRQSNAEIVKNENATSESNGLGLLEIRRKAGMPLDFAFTIIDDETFFFHLIVKFNMGD